MWGQAWVDEWAGRRPDGGTDRGRHAWLPALTDIWTDGWMGGWGDGWMGGGTNSKERINDHMAQKRSGTIFKGLENEKLKKNLKLKCRENAVKGIGMAPSKTMIRLCQHCTRPRLSGEFTYTRGGGVGGCVRGQNFFVYLKSTSNFGPL